MPSLVLEELEENKIISRKQYNEIPPRVEYSLTELGKAIEPSLEMLGKWGEMVYNQANSDNITKGQEGTNIKFG